MPFSTPIRLFEIVKYEKNFEWMKNNSSTRRNRMTIVEKAYIGYNKKRFIEKSVFAEVKI